MDHIGDAEILQVKLPTEGLNSELTDTPVSVTVVFPGAIGTNIAANSRLDMPARAAGDKAPSIKPLPAPEAARIIVDAMERLSRLAPKRAALELSDSPFSRPA